MLIGKKKMDSRQYLLNNVQTAVRDNLLGLVCNNNHLLLHSQANIVVRKDFRQNVLDQGKVRVLSGGGSGHEPSHAGFVGQGLLTGSISGNIFASPTANDVLKAIKLVDTPIKDKASKSSSGTLLIVPNYTGDRLHFGSAKEKANLEGYQVDMLVFGDDCVFGRDSGRCGKRGLAGVFFIHKCAGALAEQGEDLATIKSAVESYANRIASISVSLTACNVPGVGPSFKMPPGQLEIGLGIHGERGLKRVDFMPPKQLVAVLMDHLVGDKSTLTEYLSREDSARNQRRLAVLFNDNGGLTTMEINVIIKETLDFLTSKGFIVERSYSGRFVTSFDMIGVCISVMVIDDYILSLLDHPCSSVIFSQRETPSYKPNLSREPFISSDISTLERKFDYDRIDRLKEIETLFLTSAQAACQVIIANESYLNKLDSESGDSDCGSTLAQGARAILDEISRGSMAASFLQLAHIVENVMGGTSGALYSLLFTGASKKVGQIKTESNESKLNVSLLSEIVEAAVENVVKYSYACPGDRSMIDPLDRLLKVLKDDRSKEMDVKSLIETLVQSVEQSAMETAKMEAKIGRASYTTRDSILGPDPGAYAVYLLIKEISDCIANAKL